MVGATGFEPATIQKKRVMGKLALASVKQKECKSIFSENPIDELKIVLLYPGFSMAR
jgi:hypothetical protein